MQYKTMIFNANQPIVQQITEPLNSEYGIAVKVKKDGEFLPYEQVKVDGKGSNANRDGWACFELETDNEVGVETISVEATVAGASQDTVYNYTNTGPMEYFDGSVTVEVNLSKVSGLPETIALKDVTGTIVVSGDGHSETAYVPVVLPTEAVPFPGLESYTVYGVMIRSRSTGYIYVLIDDNGTRKWVKTSMAEQQPTWVIDPTATIPTSDANVEILSYVPEGVPQQSTWTTNIELTVSGGEGGSSVIKFPLMVNKRDMGYIERAEDKIQ